jgi:hypothetical protein
MERHDPLGICQIVGALQWDGDLDGARVVGAFDRGLLANVTAVVILLDEDAPPVLHMLGDKGEVLYDLNLGDWLITCQHGVVKTMSDADMMTLVLAAIKAKGMLQ